MYIHIHMCLHTFTSTQHILLWAPTYSHNDSPLMEWYRITVSLFDVFRNFLYKIDYIYNNGSIKKILKKSK